MWPFKKKEVGIVDPRKAIRLNRNDMDLVLAVLETRRKQMVKEGSTGYTLAERIEEVQNTIKEQLEKKEGDEK